MRIRPASGRGEQGRKVLVPGTHSSLNTVSLDVPGGGLKVNQRNKAWSRQGSTKAANGLPGPG